MKAKLNLWVCTICKGIIEGYGGSIRVESEVGKGSVFLVVLGDPAFHHKTFRLIEMFKYYYLHLYNQTSRSIDKSEQKEVNNMNNHNHNNGEPRQDENPFGGIIQRALLHQQNGSADATRQRSVGSEYRVTLDHGTIRLGPECGCDLRSSDGVVTGSAKIYASITTCNAPAKTYTIMNRRQDHEDL